MNKIPQFKQVNHLSCPPFRIDKHPLQHVYTHGDRLEGYDVHPIVTSLTHRLFNVVLSVIMIGLSLPVMVITAILIKFNNRRDPILYNHERLGTHMRPFIMHKFRTLPVNADAIVGSRIFEPGSLDISCFNRFLRETRIDEFPQLFNILKGDMDFIGPRPERAVVYESHCKSIKNYSARFTVKPGLVGTSQLLTPHRAPKRIRSYIDNRCLIHKRSLFMDIRVLAFCLYLLLKHLTVKSADLIWKKMTRTIWAKRYEEMRAIERERLNNTNLYFEAMNNGRDRSFVPGLLYDINERYFKFYSNKSIRRGDHTFLMARTIKKKNGPKGKIARCLGKIETKRRSDKKSYKYCYIFSYMPSSPLNEYMFDKYFLNRSIG